MENEFWRKELWHPLSVHFPIALLIFSTLFLIISFFFKNEKERNFKFFSCILLYAGCIAAWLSIYTGDLVEGSVARKICDPTILKRHEIAAYTMAYFFSGAAAINLVVRFGLVKNKLTGIFYYLSLLLMLIGVYYLVEVGHLGASLVYDQGAGVNMPGGDCKGY